VTCGNVDPLLTLRPIRAPVPLPDEQSLLLSGSERARPTGPSVTAGRCSCCMCAASTRRCAGPAWP
jgi:hypothetical protein